MYVVNDYQSSLTTKYFTTWINPFLTTNNLQNKKIAKAMSIHAFIGWEGWIDRYRYTLREASSEKEGVL